MKARQASLATHIISDQCDLIKHDFIWKVAHLRRLSNETKRLILDYSLFCLVERGTQLIFALEPP